MNPFRNICVYTFIVISCLASEARTVIADAANHEPLPKASVFDKTGRFIGVSDDAGVIPANIEHYDYPLTVRYIGYEPKRIETPEITELYLDEIDYELPEVSVDEKSRKLVHLTGYMRTVFSLTAEKDTLLMQSESVVDFMVPREKKVKFKGWNSPRVLSSRVNVHARLDTVTKDTTVLTGSGKAFSFLLDETFKSIDKIKVPEAIAKNGYNKITLQGKSAPREVWRTMGDNYIVDFDELADTKEHKTSPNAFKLFGLTTDIVNVDTKYKLDKSSSSEIKAEDLIMASSMLKALGKGKLYRKAFKTSEVIPINIYSELYITDKEFLTEDEAKDLKKNPPAKNSITIQAPKNISPMAGF